EPLEQLGLEGLIAFGGPIQGVFGTRNLLAFVGIIALITFTIEWRARAIPRHVATYSLVLAGILVVLSRSPTALVVVVALVVAEFALSIARRTRRPARRRTNIVIAAVTVL